MKAVINGIEVEGTPTEIADFAKEYGANAPSSKEKSEGGENFSDDNEDGEGIPMQFAYRTLKRIPMSRFQKALLFLLKKRHPDWVLASEIHKEFDWNGTQLGGVLGGLGRRLTATKGYKRSYHLWNWKWDDDEGEWAYRLPETVISALERIE